MSRRPLLSIFSLLLLTVPVRLAMAQASDPAPHTIVVTLVQVAGAKPYAFQPATFSAERGDTLRFVNGADMMHDVHFVAEPAGSHLGSATMGPYVSTKGQVYTLVVDSRFTDGTYKLVCDPHAALGMTATLTVVEPTKTAAKQ